MTINGQLQGMPYTWWPVFVLSIEAAHLPWFVDATSLKLNQLNEYYTI